MKSLVAICEDLGCLDVKTYIQSGNVVLQCKKSAANRVAQQLTSAIEKQHGFAPHVMMLGLADLDRAMSSNPFPNAETEPATLHVSFLDATPKKPDLAKLEKLKKDTERFQLKGRVFYLHAPDGIARSKLAAGIERALGVPATSRNWRTLCKIIELCEI